jgi:hypothetical protein
MPGRVLSKANEQKIRDALSSLRGLLSFMEEDDDPSVAEKDTPEKEKPATEKESSSPFISAPMAEIKVNDVMESAIDGDYIPLVEGAVRSDGTTALKLIQPGWGSSGYYPADVLKRDGPKVFTKGLKGFWNHATAQEEAARPEGDLNALAMELTSNARWQEGPAGPGLYADAKVFKPYQSAVNELAPHIGVSIRAQGKAQQGEAEGRQGPVITALTAARSIDAVTEPGAGGQILQLYEAARERAYHESENERGEQVNETEFKEAITRMESENARLRESLLAMRADAIARDAKDIVRQSLTKSALPAVSQARLLESLAANPPLQGDALDGAALLERVKNGIIAEQAYLQQAAGVGLGRVESMGMSMAAPDSGHETAVKSFAESLQRLGISKETALSVAGNTGRGF